MSKFLAGALVGLVAGLLLAPDKGENTRENLANSAEKWRDKFNELLGRTSAQLDEEMAYSPGSTRSTTTNGVA